MNVSLISKYRSCLMALAMLWVAYRHSNFPSIWKPLGFVLYTCGYGGVDAFLFLSGFGIYYACKREDKYVDYIKRRLFKVLPYSIVAMLFLFAIGRNTFKHALIEGFGLSVWLRMDWVQWYTSFIVFIYALSPSYYSFFKKRPYFITALSVMLVSILCLFLGYRNVYIFFRINIYLIGFLFGYLNDNKPDYNAWWTLLFTVFGFGLEYALLHFYKTGILYTSPFLFLIPGLMLLAAYVIDKLHFLVKPLKWLSGYSFQFYLVHEELLRFIYEFYGALYRPGIYFDWLINIAGFFISLIIAIVIKKMTDFLVKLIIAERTV